MLLIGFTSFSAIINLIIISKHIHLILNIGAEITVKQDSNFLSQHKLEQKKS